MNMRSLKPALLGSLLASAVLPIHATSVYTDPVGAVVYNLDAGAYVISAPLQKAKIFQGVLEDVDGAELTIGSSVSLDGPSYVQVLSGAAGGAIVTVASVSGSSVVLEDTIPGLAAGDSVAVRGHLVLADLVSAAGGAIPDQTTITLYNLDGTTSSYETFDNIWYDGDFGVASNVEVYPGEGFVLGLPAAAELTMVGSVAVDPVLVPLNSGVLALVGSLNPAPSVANPSSIGQIFGNLGDESTLTLYSDDGALAAVASYESFGGSWFDPDFTGVDDESLAAPNSFAVLSSDISYAILPPAFSSN